jgi:hypothetical protein
VIKKDIMSYLPIILIVVFLLSNKGGVKDFIGNFDFESITPLLSLFGVNEKTVEALSSPEIKNVLSGNADLKSMLPIIINLVTELNKPKPQENSNAYYQAPTPEALEPIIDLAPEQVKTSPGNYFHR